ncbi:MAG TPA: hypothetical protein HA349_10655 [Methanotrichaceae archaeon]|nr:hypothetical protein [Methanotrichaceae archaeon]
MRCLLSDLVDDLSAYNPEDMLLAVAGLQLMPENADRTLRLEAVAHAAASLPEDNKKPNVSLSKIKNILNTKIPPFLTHAEDPFENPFTEELSFIGGSYVVFPGAAVESTFVMRHLLKAVFFSQEFSNPNFITKVRDLISAVLILSDEIARRTGLERGSKPHETKGQKVIVPKSNDLAHLKETVLFKQCDLDLLLNKQEILMLGRLTLPLGYVNITNYNVENGDLIIHPIVKIGDKFIVAIPGMLLSAARNELVRLAIENEVVDELAERYCLAVSNTAAKSLEYLKNKFYPIALPDLPDIPCFKDGFFTLDTDKIIYTMIITDPLNNYDFEDVNGEWPNHDLASKIQNRLILIENYIFGMDTAPNEIIFLVLVQGVGRMIILGFGSPSEPLLPHFLEMSVADLETIAVLEAGERLTLWKYACAASNVREDTRIMNCFGELNEFHLYRESGYSYYINDGQRPTALMISPGSGAGVLRQEVINRLDCHAVPYYEAGYYTEVVALHGSKDIPIYIQKHHLGGSAPQVAIAIEGLPLIFWIIGPKYGDDDQRRLHGLYVQFADAIGYWLWQFTPSIRSMLQPLQSCYTRLLIRLNLPLDEAWFRNKLRDEKLGDTPFEISSDSPNGIIDMKLQPSITFLLGNENNGGERQLMRQILIALMGFLPDNLSVNIPIEIIDAVIDKHMPLGIKKKLLFINSGVAPDLDTRGLPTFRKLQKADINELLDELGNYLLSEGLNVGKIADEQRKNILNFKVVKFYYRELERLIASLQQEGLIEWLIAHHEAIISNLSVHKLTTPTRIACLESESNIVPLIRNEFEENTSAAVASRFIIEYVVARNPAGLRPMSYSVYDRLQAIAHHIINFGFMSDLIYYELADIKLNLLPSGRLGTERDQFEKARESYLPTFLAGEVVRRTRLFGHYWGTDNSVPEKTELANRIDEAAKIEFGISITDLLDLMTEARTIGQEINPVVVCLPLNDLIDYLEKQLGWQRKRVSDAIDLLSLRPRSDFFDPPTPYKKTDIFPWRFNRSLSYIRLPFLIRNHDGTTEVLWGNRHLYDAQLNLIGLCTSGRLKAKSTEMKRVLSEINNDRGRKFNDTIINAFKKNSGFIVKANIKKIGAKRLQDSNGGDLGDIDILVVNTKKRRLKIVECKDLALARTPHEMSIEIKNLFEGSRSKRPIVERHQRRVDWIRKNLKDVLARLDLELDHVGKWKIELLIIVNIELMTPHIRKSPIRVLSLAELERELVKQK